jgi:hypothetical protein
MIFSREESAQMLYRRRLGLFSGFLLCSLVGLPAHGGIIGPFDTARVLAYNQVGGAGGGGGSEPRTADFASYAFDSATTTDTAKKGPFTAGDRKVDLVTFTLPKFDKAGVAAAMGVDISKVRLEEVIIDMGTKTLGGFNVVDNESPMVGTVTDLTIGAEVEVRSTNITQQLTLSAVAKKDLCATGPMAIGTDDPLEHGTPMLFGGMILNADFAGSDSLRVDIPDMIKVADEVTRQADTTRANGDDILSEFIGDGTLDWRAGGAKIASDQSNVSRQTENESPTFDIETRVVYIYSVAPEPTTLAAIGLGVLPLLARWRKRRLGRS